MTMSSVTVEEIKRALKIIKENSEGENKQIILDKELLHQLQFYIDMGIKRADLLQERIDKAINLVNNEIYHNRCDCKYCNDYYLKQMLSILKGE